VNQSVIVALLQGGVQSYLDNQQLLKQQEEGLIPKDDKTHFNIGKAVDVRLTGSTQQYNQQFHISDLISKPTEKTKLVIDTAFLKATQLNTSVHTDWRLYRELFEEAITEIGYYPNRDMNSKLKAIADANCAPYWKDMIEAEGKILLSQEEEQTAKMLVNNFLTHSHTKDFFRNEENCPEYIDIIYQFPAYTRYMDIDCKALLDIVLINHRINTIYPLDVKTTGDYTLLFNRAIRKRRYDIQGSYYRTMLNYSLSKVSEIIGKDVSEYKLSNFGFLVESTKSPGIPMPVVLGPDAEHVGRYGGGFYKGWMHGLTIYQQWRESGFSIEKRFSITGGAIIVGTDFEYTENF